ncbi:MAG TPA: GNAT family N-acetyltransferase [Methanofastidiosum sp.]|nr:GNAT family N-acetyltransferase [Methanofastidiosum sp.]HNU61358.1 GNAT family N-acetyltransferase [Methanofastidiosum sp.]
MIRQLKKNEEIPYNLLLLADETVAAINRYINDSEIFIFEKDNKTLAVYALQKISDDTIEIKNIAVDTKHQRQGIGTLLLRDAISRAKAKGFKTIVIGTGDIAIKQLNLYQKKGFEIFDVKKGFYLDNYPEPIYENGVQLKDMEKERTDLGIYYLIKRIKIK